MQLVCKSLLDLCLTLLVWPWKDAEFLLQLDPPIEYICVSFAQKGRQLRLPLTVAAAVERCESAVCSGAEAKTCRS